MSCLSIQLPASHCLVSKTHHALRYLGTDEGVRHLIGRVRAVDVDDWIG